MAPLIFGSIAFLHNYTDSTYHSNAIISGNQINDNRENTAMYTLKWVVELNGMILSDDNWEVAYYPAKQGMGKYTHSVNLNLISIYSGSLQIPHAWELIKFITSEEYAKYIKALLTSGTYRILSREFPALNDYGPELPFDNSQVFYDWEYKAPSIPYDINGDIWDAGANYFDKVLSRELTVDAALAQFEKEALEILLKEPS